MAVSSGRKSNEGTLQRYIGVAPVTVIAVNPNKKELSEIYGNEVDEEPSYVGETEVGPEGHKVKAPNVRIDVVIQTVEENCGIIFTSKVTFFLTRAMRLNREETKVQVIDKYGRTAWVTKEEMKNHSIPMYSNGPANLDKDYRPCYMGEENLTNFIKTYLNIPNVMKYNQNTKQWTMSEHPEECEARLDDIENYFKGNFSEIRTAMALQPENKVKILFGVKTNSEGSTFQDVFKERVLRPSVTDYSKLDADVKERQNAGAYPDTTFEVCDIKPYEVNPTNFEKSQEESESDANSPWNQFNK